MITLIVADSHNGLAALHRVVTLLNKSLLKEAYEAVIRFVAIGADVALTVAALDGMVSLFVESLLSFRRYNLRANGGNLGPKLYFVASVLTLWIAENR
jgi:hypothetical protein